MSLAKCLLHGLLLLAAGQIASPPLLAKASRIKAHPAPKGLSVWGAGITKGTHDDRNYRHVTMTNGQECLLISDPRATRSDILVLISAGVSHQQDQFPVAQLLPHWLFAAQGQGPGALSLGGGLELQVLVNMDSTVLYFVSEVDISHDLAKVARGLAQSPGRRKNGPLSQALQQMAHHLAVGSPQHQVQMAEGIDVAYSEACALRESKKGLGKRAKDFFKQFYVSSRIRIVINSPLRLEQLEGRLEPFLSIRVEEVRRPDWSYREPPTFRPGQLIEIATSGGPPRLDVLWEVPIANRGEANFLTNFLIRPGPQGLANQLRSRGLARFVASRVEGFSACRDVLRISVYLSQQPSTEGWQEVVRLLLRHFSDLANAPPLEEAYMWAQSADKHAFDYRSERFDPLALRSQLVTFARGMLESSIPKDQILTWGLIPQAFNANRAWDLLKFLIPDSCRVTLFRSSPRKGSMLDLLATPPVTVLSSGDLDMNKILKDPPASAEYLPLIEIASPRPMMERPMGPRYVVGPSQSGSEACVDECNSSIYMWLEHNALYETPSIVFRFLWNTLRPSSTIENVSATHLVTLMLRRVLVELVEEARVAQVLIDTYATREGIVFSFVGRIELIALFLSPLLDAIVAIIDLLPQLFGQFQKEYALQLKGQPPGEAMDDWLNRTVDSRHYNVQQLEEAIRKLTHDQCASMFHAWLERASLRVLFFGDLGHPDSSTRSTIKTKIMPLLRTTFAHSHFEQQPSPRNPIPDDLDAPEARVVPGRPLLVVAPLLEGSRGAIRYFARVEPYLIALTQLYVPLFRTDFLRAAVDQLGGGALATIAFRRSPLPTGILFGVSAEGCTPEDLEGFVAKFIQGSIGQLVALSDGDFLKVRKAVIKERRRRPSWLVEAADVNWTSIENHQVDGITEQLMACSLEKISRDKMVDQVRKFMLPDGEFSKIAILHGWGAVHKEQRAKKYPDLPEDQSRSVWRRKKGIKSQVRRRLSSMGLGRHTT